ncbi:MAG: hypothetical protein K8T89_02450 [Planctomycetes bacterium]|nr:hypothetical protein [Planctomycetota bacterium]
MRSLFAISFLLILTPLLSAQTKEERRYGIRYNAEVYPQASAKQVMASLIQAFDKDRYDYIVAFMLDPRLVDEQLRNSYPYYEKLARQQVEMEEMKKKQSNPIYVRDRIRSLAEQANFENLTRRVKAKLDDDPVAMKELRKLAREGEYIVAGDAMTVSHKDIKDHVLYLRNMAGRWYLENKMQE